MFSNLALSPGAFISFSGMLECCSLSFQQKLANHVIRLSNSGLLKAGKIIKIPYFLTMLISAINLLNFNVLIRR